MKCPTQPGNGNGGPSLPQWAAPSQLGCVEVVGGWPIAIHYQSQSVPSMGYLLPLLAFPLSFFSFYIFVLFSSFTKTIKIWSLWGHQWHSFKWSIIVRSPKPSLCKSLFLFFFQVVFISFLFLPRNFLLSFTVPDGLVFISPGGQNGHKACPAQPESPPCLPCLSSCPCPSCILVWDFFTY